MWISRCKPLEIFSTKKPVWLLLQIVEKVIKISEDAAGQQPLLVVFFV